MQFDSDKISSYYHSSSKPSFLFYRVSVIVSMVVLLSILGINLYMINQTTSTTSQAAEPSIFSITPSQSTSVNQQTLPPLPPQCYYERSSETTVKCVEGGKTCTYKIVDNKYQMTCDQ